MTLGAIGDSTDTHVAQLDGNSCEGSRDAGIGRDSKGNLRGHARHMSTSMLHLQPQPQPQPSSLMVVGGSVNNVLAAAARIDRGELLRLQPPSSHDQFGSP